MLKRKSNKNDAFIERAIKIHGNKYDYTQVNYINSNTKVGIICKAIDKITGDKHGEFWQRPYSHLSGASCPRCSNSYMDKEIFIKRASIIHKNKYDYSKVVFTTVKNKVIIICLEHGEFSQTPDSHLQGQRCSGCSGVFRYNTEKWIDKVKSIHGDKYDYSKVVYKNNSTKVCIICKSHGEFWQLPSNHIKGKNCPKCTGHYLDKNFFIEKSINIFKDIDGKQLYDYSLVDYKDSSSPVTIICHKIDSITGKEHGRFIKTPNKHLNGQGCPICGNESGGLKNRLSNEQFLKKAFINDYDYLSEYITAKTKIHIRCKKCDYTFWQEAFSHLSGSGCPACNESKLEREVTRILKKYNVNHIKQKKFDWLGRLSLDFYLEDFEIAIECQGIQHFEPKDFFGGNNGLAEILRRDNIKLTKCLSNNLKMLYVIDNVKYKDNKYHFNNSEPFLNNVSYDIIHINHFEAYLDYLICVNDYFKPTNE